MIEGSIGFLLGAVVAIVFFGMGVVVGDSDYRNHKRQSNDDRDMRIYVPHRIRDRRGNNGCNKQVESEEVKDRLQNLRLSLSEQEKKDVDYACECVDKVERIYDYINAMQGL